MKKEPSIFVKILPLVTFALCLCCVVLSILLTNANAEWSACEATGVKPLGAAELDILNSPLYEAREREIKYLRGQIDLEEERREGFTWGQIAAIGGTFDSENFDMTPHQAVGYVQGYESQINEDWLDACKHGREYQPPASLIVLGGVIVEGDEQ